MFIKYIILANQLSTISEELSTISEELEKAGELEELERLKTKKN